MTERMWTRMRRSWTGVADRFAREDVTDASLALLLATAVALETLRGRYQAGPEWVVVVTGLLVVLPLALRRRRPLAVHVAVSTLIVGQLAVLGSVQSIGAYFALLVTTFTLAARRPTVPAVAGLAVLIPVTLFAHYRDPAGALGDFDDVAALLAGFWVAGRTVWSRQKLVDQLLEQAQDRKRLRIAETRLLSATDRARVARELHDTIAHDVSVILVQAESGESALPDTDRSARALRGIQDTGLAVLAALRQQADVLGDDSARDEPQRAHHQHAPGLRDAYRLVAQLQEAGVDVDLTVQGNAVDVPPGVDLAAYRVLQEALTNTLRHAGGTSVDAQVRVSADEIVIEVLDRGPLGGRVDRRAARGAGRGLEGLRQRVSLHGGELESGPADPGFRVRARFPVPGPT